MAARNDLIVFAGILLCLVIAADADPIVNPSLLESGTASPDDNIPIVGNTCKDGLPTTYVATFAAEKYTDNMCGISYIAKCDSDAATDPSYVDPCINEQNDSSVTVTIIGKCDETVQQNCNSFVQLSTDAYKEIADPSLSQLIQINYGPQQTTSNVPAV